jgi:hypothetical protein
LVDDIQSGGSSGRIWTPDSDMGSQVSLTREITLGPCQLVIFFVEISDDVTETTVFLDTDEMVNLAIGASHACDGASHDVRWSRG